MELLQRLNQEEIHRKPDGAAPVGVATEDPGVRFRRLVVHRKIGAVDIEDIRVLGMHTGERPNPIVRQELPDPGGAMSVVAELMPHIGLSQACRVFALNRGFVYRDRHRRRPTVSRRVRRGRARPPLAFSIAEQRC
jgi:hypothetical protein